MKTEIWIDPIVEEARRAGEQLARQADFDLHKFCENLRAREREHPERLSRRMPDPVPREPLG